MLIEIELYKHFPAKALHQREMSSELKKQQSEYILYTIK